MVSGLCFSFLNWIFPFSRSILDDDWNDGGESGIQKYRITKKYQEVPKITKKHRSQLFPLWSEYSRRSKVSWITCSLSPNESLLFLDPASTMIGTLSSIKGEWISPIFLQMNFFLLQISHGKSFEHTQWAKVGEIHFCFSKINFCVF